ncbi:MAG: hypothetical protein ACFFCX_14865 [Candidatus Sifarchaeia archaeon]
MINNRKGDFLGLHGQKLSILLLIFCLLFSLGVTATSAQARSEHETILGTPKNDLATDMVLDSTGSVIVVGRSEAIVEPFPGEFYLVKISSTGETLWTKSWNVSSDDMLLSVTVDSADNILVTGVSNSTSEQKSGIIYKIDPYGEIIWSVTIDDFNYDWFWMGDVASTYCFDIMMHPDSDDFFVIGSVNTESSKTLVARYNISGSLVWRTEWYGPSDSLGSIAGRAWLSSQNLILVSGRIFGTGADPYTPFNGWYLAAFDLDGNQMWNHTRYPLTYGVGSGEPIVGFEINPDEFLSVGSNFDEILCVSYDLNITWTFDMTIEDYSVLVTGFVTNESENVIGYGEITSLTAEQAVIKSYRPAYSGIQPPQTLIFSFTLGGELQWYDFLVLGRISNPCGSQFDTSGRLIVAGHTSTWDFESNDFYIVFGFVQTPFPVHHDSLAVYIFPLFNVVSLGSIWVFFRIRSRNMMSISDSKPRVNIKSTTKTLLLIEVVLFAVLYTVLIGPYGGGGPPPPLVYYPEWVAYTISGLFYGLPILIAAHLIIWFKDRTTKSGNQ